MRVLYLYDYKNEIIYTPIDLDNLEDINELTITVVSGDEILDILYTDNESDQVDSCPTRQLSFFDGTYILYSKRKGIDRLGEFMSRKDSYTMLKQQPELSHESMRRFKVIECLRSAKRQVKEMKKETFTIKEVCEMFNDLIDVISRE